MSYEAGAYQVGFGLSFLAFASTASVSALVTLAVSWGQIGPWRTKLAIGAGSVAGLLIIRFVWLWRDDPSSKSYDWLVHLLIVTAALAGAIVPPWRVMGWVARRAYAPRHPNETWTPPPRQDPRP